MLTELSRANVTSDMYIHNVYILVTTPLNSLLVNSCNISKPEVTITRQPSYEINGIVKLCQTSLSSNSCLGFNIVKTGQ